MKNLIRLLSIILFFTFTLTGCYYDKENELYPLAGNCDTAGIMTYSGSIAPIMVANCNTCHGAGNASGVVTTNYDGLSVIAKNGMLWSSVNWEGAKMPKGGDKLSACDLYKINKWVNAGSLDN
ncbi:MAG: c-type cytochrome [Bacteroidales bacterium]